MSRQSDNNTYQYSFRFMSKFCLSPKNGHLSMEAALKNFSQIFCGLSEATKKVCDVSFRLNQPQPTIDKRYRTPFIQAFYGRSKQTHSSRPQHCNRWLRLLTVVRSTKSKKIVGQSIRWEVRQYLFNWKGYHNHENTWLSEAELTNCKNLLGNTQRNYIWSPSKQTTIRREWCYSSPPQSSNTDPQTH